MSFYLFLSLSLSLSFVLSLLVPLLPIKGSSSWRSRWSRYRFLVNALNSRSLISFSISLSKSCDEKIMHRIMRRFVFPNYYCDALNRSEGLLIEKDKWLGHQEFKMLLEARQVRSYELTENIGLRFHQNYKIERMRKGRFSALSFDRFRPANLSSRAIFARFTFRCSITFSAREFSCDSVTRTANDNVTQSTRGRDKATATNWKPLKNDDNDDDDDDESNGDDCSFLTTNDTEPSVFLFLFFMPNWRVRN